MKTIKDIDVSTLENRPASMREVIPECCSKCFYYIHNISHCKKYSYDFYRIGDEHPSDYICDSYTRYGIEKIIHARAMRGTCGEVWKK